MEKVTIVQKISNVLSQLEIGQTVNKINLVKSIYGDYNYFISRSFDVALYKSKVSMNGKWFKTIKGEITRLK